jgi:hypothetical protein
MSFKKIQCCNHCTYRLAIFTAKPIATEVFFKSCNWSAYGLAIKVLCGLAIRGSCCNQFTLRVANTECFRLIIYYPFNCNQIVVQVTIDFTLRVANNEYVRLILYYPLQLQPNSGSSCNQFTLPSCKYRVLSLDNILPLQLQPDSGSSCNRCTLRVANTECFLLIIYYPFSCNPIVVRVAIDVHSELQILSAFSW